MITRTLCIDPGLGGTGWSLWASVPMAKGQHGDVPMRWGFEGSGGFVPKGESIQERIAALHTRVLALAQVALNHPGKQGEVTIAVEHPQYFAGAGATNASGALVTLAMAAGAALSVAGSNSRLLPLLVPLSWKGQLPKEICCKRIVERMRRDPRYAGWSPQTNATHELDAIGIGLHLQGRF